MKRILPARTAYPMRGGSLTRVVVRHRIVGFERQRGGSLRPVFAFPTIVARVL
jgi:hypothetical protein